jgi:hypothetical protein
MEIENKKKTIKINQMRYIAVIIFLPLIVLLLTSDVIEDTLWGLNKYHWAIVLTLIYIGLNIYEHIRDYNYIYVDDSEEKILFRYISLQPLKNRKYSIEIEKGKFYKYKIVRSFMNIRKHIILYVNTPHGIAKYPPISITALDEDNMNKLKKLLNQYAA